MNFAFGYSILIEEFLKFLFILDELFIIIQNLNKKQSPEFSLKQTRKH